MQTIPSNLNAEELLRWYDSTWNKLTNSEMEQRLADALGEIIDETEEARAEEKEEIETERKEWKEREETLLERIAAQEKQLARIKEKAEEITRESVCDY